ncbi:GNAT family N-acetyltransferase [Kordiimonas aquimaris]|uniref:GNAT family N-acetyltransferase n=1 Tax=Kordiimonas aquimaris TaxID=707591 RepID=UPI0021D3C859|nr:GNAT family N-acetyltransferase [Kordiimonas aquimaris]
MEPYWDLLLLADPSPELVQSYLKSGKVFGAIIGGMPVGVYVLVCLGSRDWELKNIAIHEAYQGKGYGQALLRHSIGTAKELGACSLEVGTASSGVKQVKFYEQAGFKRARIDEGFFVRNYDEPVLDDGVLCVDMLYLKLTF